MATYCTRIFVKVDAKELMEKLCALDVTDLGKGFYKAEDIFDATSVESEFNDSESAINESDLQTLVERVVEVMRGHGTILADTYSYDYDPFPQVCYYNGGEIITKLLEIDGDEFGEMTEIADISGWIQFVENPDACAESWTEDEENYDFSDDQAEGLDEETLRDVFGIVADENGFAFRDDGFGCVTLYNYFGKEHVISIPDGIIEFAAGCFAGNDVITEVTIPETVQAMEECCFSDCLNLQKVHIPASVTGFGCDNSSFSKCPNLTIYAPAGSAAESYAKENNIPFIAE